MAITKKAADLVSSKQVFKLGYFLFKIKHCKIEFLDSLTRLLPEASVDEAQYPEVEDLDMNCTEEPRALFNNVLKRHYKCLWIDAACVVSPTGQKVLIAGPAGAGKSTLSLALAIKFNWSVVSEDVTLTDPESGQVLNFAAPFAVNSDSVQQIARVAGATPPEVLLNEWVRMGSMTCSETQKVPFDAAVYIDSTVTTEQFTTSPLSVESLIERLLPISNLARKKGVEKFAGYLPRNNCHFLASGTLEERMQLLRQIGDRTWAEGNSDSTANGYTKSFSDATSKAKRYLRAAHVACFVTDDGNCVIAGRRDVTGIVLGPAGALIFEFCDGEHTLKDIVSELQQLGVDIEFDESQVAQLLEQLVNDGFVSQV